MNAKLKKSKTRTNNVASKFRLSPIISLCVILLFCGCSSKLEHKAMHLRSNSPEVSGGLLTGKVDVQFINSATRIYATLDEDLDGNQNDSDKQRIQNQSSSRLRADLGLHKIIDIYYRTGWATPNIFGIKLQLAGEPRNIAEFGWKSSISAEYGIYNVTDNSNGLKEYSNNLYDISISIGKRFNSRVLLYYNFFYSRHKLDGNLSRDGNTKYSIDGVSSGFGGLIGLDYTFLNNEKFLGLTVNTHLAVEVGAIYLNWIDTRNHVNNITYQDETLRDSAEGITLSTGISWY